MSKLNNDILFLILEELSGDIKSLRSCLLVNKTWCEISVSILWRNPSGYFKRGSLNLIISHLSNETKEYLKSEGILSSVILRKKPLFNYVGFIRYLDLTQLEQLLELLLRNVKENKVSNIINEILELFINGNTRVTHLRIPSHFNRQIHLISGADHYFSGLKFLFCSTDDTNQNILEGLSKISKSIRKMELYVLTNNYTGIIKLIEAQKNLNQVWFCCQNQSIRESLEDSLRSRTEIVRHVKLFFN
ncbi:hypothetical protein RclHR1_09400001 [Rhizophagus clarus]|uniref:F-box domain-containing protein n=1 Tax=Rhizophagus clarus TaxID=94130 RepID=A0A2Z6SQM7_9GLOM|nr:hypothetical protein RclHR1_09400001 [Rhizophagus clarus]